MDQPSLRDVFGKMLIEIGEQYSNLVVLDADLSVSTRTTLFAQKFPSRFFNMGIAEQNLVGTALGFAISNKIPIVSGFSIFTTGRAWEFIRLACHDNLNVKIITTHGGFVGEDGSTHNALEDLTLMATLPNMTVLVPSDDIELRQMMHLLIETQGPFYVRLPRGVFPTIHDPTYQFLLGVPDSLMEGANLCLIGVGYGTHLALQSAKKFQEKHDKSIKVLNLSTIKPLNTKRFLKELHDIEKVVVIEEHNTYCGVGSIIAKILSENSPRLVKIIGVNDSYGQSGSRELNLKAHGLELNQILKSMEKLLER
jgi:transketolase